MYPSQHLFLGIIFSAILFVIFPFIGLMGFLIIIFSTVLIDVDHYIWYVYKKKDWNLKRAYQWFIRNEIKTLSFPRNQRNTIYGGFCFLHGVEFLIILFLGIFISEYFLFVFVGVGFHLLLDIIAGTLFTDRIDRLSIVHDFFKFKKLRYIETL